MAIEPDDNQVVTPCPGADMKFDFGQLTPGQSYIITLDAGLSFTRAASGIEGVQGQLQIARTEARFTASHAIVGFTLGVAISNNEVSLSTNLSGPESIAVSLMSGSASGPGGPLAFKALEDGLPPTCVILNPHLPRCSVCAMDAGKCSELMAIEGGQFCLGRHIYLGCIECPGSETPLDPSSTANA